jgi:hypothetical protein
MAIDGDLVAAECDSPFLASRREGEQLSLVAENVAAWQVVELEQAFHCLRVRLNSTVGPDVADFKAIGLELRSDEQSPMAEQRITLSANDGDAIARGPVTKASETFVEARGCGEKVVSDLAIGVHRIVARSGPKLPPQKNVFDPLIQEH